MAEKDYTHILAADHQVIRDGDRVTLPAGTKFAPTPEQLANMPDRFIPIGQAIATTADPASVGTPKVSDPSELTVAAIDTLVRGIDDLATLHAMREKEEGGRGRVSAVRAISARIDELTPGDEEPEE